MLALKALKRKERKMEKRMLAILVIAMLILGFAFALAEAQTNYPGNFVKPNETKVIVINEGATQKVYCDSGQVGAYSILAKSYNGGPGYSKNVSPLLYVNVFHSQDRKAWRWLDLVVMETIGSGSNGSVDRGTEQKFFFSRKLDGFYCLELSHAFDSIPGSKAGKVSATIKTFSWNSLLARPEPAEGSDIDSATRLAPPSSAGMENPDGFSDLSSPQREAKMKLNDLGADYNDQAKKLSVILRIAAESISTNPARIAYAKYLPAKGDEANLDLVKYKNLFYVRVLAGSANSFANSLLREPAFRVYSQDLAKAADELKKTTDKWQIERMRQLPRQRLTTPPDKVFQEAAESMRKVASCVDAMSEAMKSNLILAEGSQIRRFAPLLARELPVPVIEQSGDNCGKTATLMGIKYFHPDLSIDESWLNPDKENGINCPLALTLKSAGLEFRKDGQSHQFRGNQENWLSLLKGSIFQGYPVWADFSPSSFLLWRGGPTTKGHALIVRGFGSDGSVIINENSGGNRFVVDKEKFGEAWGYRHPSYEGLSFFGVSLRPLESTQPQTSSVSEVKDDTLVFERKPR